MFPNLNRIVICEEKYSFTPDDFKAATRQNRQASAKSKSSISHLKIGHEILSSGKLSKSAILHTDMGKRMISNYLARNINHLKIKRQLTLDVDSELIITDCQCSTTDSCSCENSKFTTPVRGTFTTEGYQSRNLLGEIKQRKGEAEMAQLDWLIDIKDELQDKEAVVSIVTSADIDSIVLHLFVLSLHWPRSTSGSFKNTVYVLLQKQKVEIYNITSIIETLEERFGRGIARNVAVAFCIGGNDFVPKFHSISHEKWIRTIIEGGDTLERLVDFTDENGKITGSLREEVFLDIVKKLYCPSTINADLATLDQIRQLSIKYPGKQFRPLVSWMPPKTALQNLVKLINCQIEYMMTAGTHDATLPNFMGAGCLKRDSDGAIQFDFGTEVRIQKMEEALTIAEDGLLLLISRAGKNKKKRQRSATNTPTKPRRERKRKPMMSTPIKMKRQEPE